MAVKALSQLVLLVLSRLAAVSCARDLRLAASSLAELAKLTDSRSRQWTACTESSSTFCLDKTDGMYESPCSAASFFSCSQGTLNIQECEPGLIWEKSCHCCTKSPLAEPLDQSTDQNAIGAKPFLEVSALCQGRADGMYSSPDSPSDFIHCTRGAAFTLHCNRDLVWDQECNCCTLPTAAFLASYSPLSDSGRSVKEEAVLSLGASSGSSSSVAPSMSALVEI